MKKSTRRPIAKLRTARKEYDSLIYEESSTIRGDTLPAEAFEILRDNARAMIRDAGENPEEWLRIVSEEQQHSRAWYGAAILRSLDLADYQLEQGDGRAACHYAMLAMQWQMFAEVRAWELDARIGGEQRQSGRRGGNANAVTDAEREEWRAMADTLRAENPSLKSNKDVAEKIEKRLAANGRAPRFTADRIRRNLLRMR